MLEAVALEVLDEVFLAVGEILFGAGLGDRETEYGQTAVGIPVLEEYGRDGEACLREEALAIARQGSRGRLRGWRDVWRDCCGCSCWYGWLGRGSRGALLAGGGHRP